MNLNLKVFVSQNKHTQSLSTWSWGLGDEKSTPILTSCQVFDTEKEAMDNMNESFKEWGMQLNGEFSSTVEK
tara:strand:+ start:277 stop:492 length:216 start_codon:yes stop_codon:yes gene_type:complete